MSVPKPSIKVDAAHSDNIWSLNWTTQSQILTGSLDGTIKLWSINQESSQLQCQAVSKRRHVAVTSVLSSKDNSTAVVCYQDSVIKFYSLIDLTESLQPIEAGILEAWTISLSPSDDVIAAGTHKGTVNIWSTGEGHELVGTLDAHCKFILSTDFNMDNKLATSSVDGYLNVFDIETKQVIHKIEAHSLPARKVTFSYDGNGSIINSFSQTGMALSVDVSTDHRHFTVGCSDHTVSYWDLGMQRRIQSYDTHKDQVWSVSFDKYSNKSNRFASVGDDSLIQIYE
eukprot:gene20370-26438_t